MGNNTSIQRGRRHGLSTATVASTETGGSDGSGSGKAGWRLRGHRRLGSRSRSPAGADRKGAGGGAVIGAGAGRVPGGQGAMNGALVPDIAAVPLTDPTTTSSSNTHHLSVNTQRPSMSQPQTVPCQVSVTPSFLPCSSLAVCYRPSAASDCMIMCSETCLY